MSDGFCNDILHLLGVDKSLESKFELFFELLVDYNSHTNITSITDRYEVFVKHFADSILPQKFFVADKTVVDIGCGAGFPSLPLAIVRPDLQFTLVDSVAKKLKFVTLVASSLKLDNIKVLHSRAEDLQLRQQFDYGVARAVAPLATLVEYVLPFVKVNGHMLAYKSNDIDQELQTASSAIAILGGTVQQVLQLPITTTDIIRKIVVICKSSPTPPKYPRGQNKPRLKPL